MMKSILLASAVLISVPVLAQTAPSTAQDQSAVGATAADSAQTLPATGSAATTSDPAAAAPAAQATPVTTAAGIAQVVNTEFPTYDKNADGELNKTEFSAWMVALKTASDPTTKASSPAVKTWITGAFASADTNKNQEVSKDELTGFLAKGQS